MIDKVNHLHPDGSTLQKNQDKSNCNKCNLKQLFYWTYTKDIQGSLPQDMATLTGKEYPY
jgi:hypothetical protein